MISKIAGLFSSKDKTFVPLLKRGSGNLVEMNAVLLRLLATGDERERQSYFGPLEELEHTGDRITHEIIMELGENFLTPFDREDIHCMATTIDDIADNMLAIAEKIDLYKIKVIPFSVVHLIEHIGRCITEINDAVGLLSSVKNIRLVKEHCIRISSIENEAAKLIGASLADLLRNATDDPIEQIKLNELFNVVEVVLEKCEDMANILELIPVKIK